MTLAHLQPLHATVAQAMGYGEWRLILWTGHTAWWAK